MARSVGYDGDQQVLEVEFHNDRVYQYYVVPRGVYRELMAAESFGRFFNERVRDRYPARRVDG